MSPGKTVSDVFLSFPQSETAWAAAVERRMLDAGLSVFVARDVPGLDADAADRTWDAMAESAAVVSLARGPRETSPSLLFEVGAAMAWNKPVYVVYAGDPPADLPKYVNDFGVFPADRIDHVIGLVRNGEPSMTERERDALVRAYKSVGVTIDQMLLEPAKSDQLVRAYRRNSKSRIPGEQLFRELLHMRKRGQLVSTARGRAKGRVARIRQAPTQRAAS
jgi:hypothetical protein